jgi:hypothetical protein
MRGIVPQRVSHQKAQKHKKRKSGDETRQQIKFLFLVCVFVAGIDKMACRQKERALTSPKTSALAFISVLPWRINDGQDTNCQRPEVGCSKLVKPLRGCDKSFSKSHKEDNYRRSEINESRIGLC